HVLDMEHLEAIVEEVPEKAWILAKAYCPGPLTMIFRKNERVPYETTGGLDTVAVRIPDHPVARALIASCGGYIAAPSANTSGRPSPTTAQHVAEDLDGKIDMIIDGGQVRIGLESTIVDFTEDIPCVLRPGYINLAMLRECLGEVKMDPGLMKDDPSVRPKAPGMRYRHYAPKATMTIYQGEYDKVAAAINDTISQVQGDGKKAAVLCVSEHAGDYHCDNISILGSMSSEEDIARHLYGSLRDFDEAGVDIICSEAFDFEQMGEAIMNRLLKAAGHRVILCE
ncbi:MAG: threonylcarbamoyl-AMP synthase, partial [Lachnospiraceae bacterium]|nr:threonylcarbamoyl-AMP synthase [Candidatus Equihabitans merdae]